MKVVFILLTFLLVKLGNSVDYQFIKFEKCESSNPKVFKIDDCICEKKRIHFVFNFIEKIEKCFVI